jgi:ubiquitin C-terminal hydrolase
MQGADVRNQTNLSMCIEKYCQKEQLEDSEMWFCYQCKRMETHSLVSHSTSFDNTFEAIPLLVIYTPP